LRGFCFSGCLFDALCGFHGGEAFQCRLDVCNDAFVKNEDTRAHLKKAAFPNLSTPRHQTEHRATSNRISGSGTPPSLLDDCCTFTSDPYCEGVMVTSHAFDPTINSVDP
jgi:hypothetical protein